MNARDFILAAFRERLSAIPEILWLPGSGEFYVEVSSLIRKKTIEELLPGWTIIWNPEAPEGTRGFYATPPDGWGTEEAPEE